MSNYMMMEIFQNVFISIAFVGNFIFLLLNLILMFISLSGIKKINKTHNKFIEDYMSKLDKADFKVRKIIDNTLDKSKYIIDDLSFRSEDIQKQVNKNMAKLVDKASLEFEQFILKLNKDADKQTKDMVMNMINNAQKELFNFIKQLKTETVSTKQEFANKLQNEFDKVVSDVYEYREKQLSLVEKSINRIIIKVVESVLSEGISVSEHERLITESLEKAKREEVFK